MKRRLHLQIDGGFYPYPRKDPVTALAVAGTGYQVFSSISQGNQANTNAKYQAELYQRQADRERQVAALDEEEYRRRGSALLASQRARLGGAGVDFTGTGLDVASDTAAELELQALKIRSGGLARADDLESQAALTRYGGSVAKRQGYLNAAGAVFSGGSGYFKDRRMAQLLSGKTDTFG